PPRSPLFPYTSLFRSAVAVLGIAGREAPLKHPQAQLGVLGDAPVGPADLVQHAAAGHGHGAVLDDGVAFVAGDHADVEEALVLRSEEHTSELQSREKL